ncbi:tRNA lysidine(34) synthetase TilS [Thermoproteota archaeon]
MFEILNAFQTQHNLLTPNDKVIISFSCGPDSVCLFEYLYSFLDPKNMICIYFDHGLRSEEVKQEREFVLNLGASKNVKTIIKKIPVTTYSKNYKVSLETAGRHLRRVLIAHYCRLFKTSKVTLAHHTDDTCETVLLQLIRGGLSGIMGIKPMERLDKNAVIIRPLLALKKSEILDYLGKNNIHYCIDSSNQDHLFSRNKIRGRVMPVLSEINPGFGKVLDRFTTYQSQIYDYLNQEIRKCTFNEQINKSQQSSDKIHNKYLQTSDLIFKKCLQSEDRKGKGIFGFKKKDVASLKNQPVLQRQFIYNVFNTMIHDQPLTFRQCRLYPDAFHIDQIVSCWNAEKMTRISLPGGYECELKTDEISIHQCAEPELITDYEYQLDPCVIEESAAKHPYVNLKSMPDSDCDEADFKNLYIKESNTVLSFNLTPQLTSADLAHISEKLSRVSLNEAFIDYAKLGVKTLVIRGRRPGDVFHPFKSPGKKSLKKYFIDKKIHKSKRDNMPLVFCGDECIWVPGCQIADRVRITDQTKQILHIKIQDKQ